MDRTALIKHKMKEKLYMKKLAKIQNLNKKENGAKKYKKFLLIRKFAEDDDQEEEKKGESQIKIIHKEALQKKKAELLLKYRAVKL